jgi:hypothetical protein
MRSSNLRIEVLGDSRASEVPSRSPLAEFLQRSFRSARCDVQVPQIDRVLALADVVAAYQEVASGQVLVLAP